MRRVLSDVAEIRRFLDICRNLCGALAALAAWGAALALLIFAYRSGGR